jgi:hypothetical protein
MRRLIPILCTTSLAVLVGFTAPAAAELLTVVPPGFETTGGGFQGPAPLRFKNISGTGGSRTQQVYESQLFGGDFSGPRAITAIDLRTFPGAAPSAFFGNSVTLSDVVIRLSTTQRGDEGNTLSANFADNIGNDDTIVYSGALTLTTATNGTLPVSPFDYTIVFQNPFIYDPLAGNLLLDVNIPVNGTLTTAGFGFLTFDTVNALNDGVYSVFNGDNGNATSGTAGTSGAILRVHSEAANSVPEPGTLALFAAGLVAVAATQHRRRETRIRF